MLLWQVLCCEAMPLTLPLGWALLLLRPEELGLRPLCLERAYLGLSYLLFLPSGMFIVEFSVFSSEMSVSCFHCVTETDLGPPLKPWDLRHRIGSYSLNIVVDHCRAPQCTSLERLPLWYPVYTLLFSLP